MAELKVNQLADTTPSVDNNSGKLNTKNFIFSETAFTRNFQDPSGGQPGRVTITSTPQISLKLSGFNVIPGNFFDAVNSENLTFDLPDSYAIHNGHLYQFFKSIDSIITDYEAIGCKLVSNHTGLLVFVNPLNVSEVYIIKGTEIDPGILDFNFTIRSSASGVDSDQATFSFSPWGNVNLKTNYILNNTGEPDSAYDVAVNNGFVGTEQQWLDSLVGDQGPEGPQGPKGNDGTSVTILGEKATTGDLPPSGNQVGDGYIVDLNLWVWDGAQWILAGEIKGPKGDKGDTGADGRSAYQVWLDAGNVGTVQDYLASIKGDKGDKGDQGPIGPTGPEGPAGSDANVTANNIETALGFPVVEMDNDLRCIQIPLSQINVGVSSTEEEVQIAVASWIAANVASKLDIETIAWEIYEDAVNISFTYTFPYNLN